jgi:CheY-like chemotaxis protein
MTDVSDAALKGRRVLVVEDEYFVADDIARTLQESGAEVIGPVGDIAAAMQLLSAGARIDAAVLDVNVRGEMIYPLADALRRHRVPFVFATGYDDASIPGVYADVARCVKPFDWPLLVTAVGRIMGGKTGGRGGAAAQS